MQIGLATGNAWQRLTAGDVALFDALTRTGHSVRTVVWDDATVEWASLDAVVVRSCWDYYLRPAEFLARLGIIRDSGARVFNDPALIAWNIDKRYLIHLRDAGVAIVPTAVAADGAVTKRIAATLGSGDLVVKPAVSAAAKGLQRLSAADLPRQYPEAMLVQPFMPEIAAGERSVVVLGGELSHVILKRAAPGDFRVQEEYGGSSELATITTAERELIARILRLLDPTPLYARVDLLRVTSGPQLMELELIEPELFFHLADGSPERFVAALEHQMRASFRA